MTENITKMAEFVLKSSYFKFDSSVFQQILDTAIMTKFTPLNGCIFMNQLKIKFLETQILKPLFWFRYIDDIFFICAQIFIIIPRPMPPGKYSKKFSLIKDLKK